MNKIFSFIIAFTLACLPIAAQKNLVILHTNDSHSTIEPLNVNIDDTLKAGRGGFLRRIEMINEERMANPNLLLFDSGDFSQGSPYYTLFKGDVEVKLMNKMNYDAVTIGNHEFDFGLENMARLFKMASFPIVCSNYDFTGTPIEGLVKSYIVIKREGVKIGVFGICPKLDGLVSKQNYVGVQYLDPVAKAQEMTDFLRNNKKCDVVICLSHLGWNLMPEMCDNIMIEKTHGIDLVLGGHSHSYFSSLEKVRNDKNIDVAVDQNGKHAIFVGKLTLAIQNRK